MTDELLNDILLQELQDFILECTRFEFKEVNNDLYIWAFFRYDDINLSIEEYGINRNEELGASINRIILMMIGDETKKSYKIFKRNQKIENILK